MALILQCDGCGVTFDADCRDKFGDRTREAAQKAGWKIQKLKGKPSEWNIPAQGQGEDYCPKCSIDQRTLTTTPEELA